MRNKTQLPIRYLTAFIVVTQLLQEPAFSQTTIDRQSPISFSHYSSPQGLSSTTVYDIMMDSYGFLWLATEYGLNRFDGTNFKVYQHDPSNPNGLGVNDVTSVYESNDGCIWIGTNGGGLNYYDRNKDSVFSYKPGGPIYISSVINSLSGDAHGQVWVTSYGAVNIINSKNKETVGGGEYERLIKEVQGKISLCFLQDSRRRAWVGTNTGLYMYDAKKNQLQIFKHQPGNSTSLPSDVVNKIVEDKNGNIWMATENGLAMFDTTGFRNYSPGAPYYKISNGTISSLAADDKNRLWIGTEEGLDILDIATNQLTNCVPDKRDSRSISTRPIRSLFIDKKGVYWVGTFRGGLNKYDKNANNFHLKAYNAFDPMGLRSPLVTSFAAYQNDVFIGTDGGGLQRYHRNTGLLDHINLPVIVRNSNHDLSILAMEKARDGEIWVGTFSNGLYRYQPAGNSYRHYAKGNSSADLNSNDIFCLKEDRNGNTWVGTNGGGLNLIKPGGNEIQKFVHSDSNPDDPAKPASNFIRCLEEDRNGRIWVGTFGSGLSVFDPATQSFTFYNKWNSGLPSNYVLTVKEDSHGNIWAGTGGNGIGLLKKGSNKFQLLSEQEGLANSSINQIVEDASGKIWISTNSGLSCYDPAAHEFKNYSSADGLQAGAFVPGAGLMLPDGELFFGGQNGFNHFNPARFTLNKNIPPIVFTHLTVDNQPAVPSKKGAIEQPILLANELRLSYKQSFSIGFEALDFTVPEANRYEYMLTGFDKTWVSPGKEHKAYYGNIPPGEYTFTVRASNNDGVWNKEGRSIKVVVAPPVWRTVYAYIAYILLIAALLFFMRRQAIRKIQIRYAIEQERKEARQLIERERKEAEYLHKLDQVKIKFLTNLSHEFRTPISLIMGPVDSLIGQIKDDTLMNQLNLIKRNSKRLLNLVNQLLDFRKMEERELKLHCTEGDIIQFTREVCDSFNDLARRKKIEFGFYTNQNLLPVLFDYNKVERILFNLLSNAFKFTPENGNIAVLLQASEEERTPGFPAVTIAVKDSGIGIPKEVQSHIFESFFQHETGSEISNHGTGIGLSIAREFVRLHNGTIWVESEPGKGSTFTFKLALHTAGTVNKETIPQLLQHSENIEKSNATHISTTQPSILIVEDDDDFRFYLKENLKNTYRIFEAPNGKDGWQRALFHHPDIIVCDVQMPVMNGLELAQKLKGDKRTKHIPLILLTAANTIDATLDGLESGAIDYMTKPFDFAVLHAKIHNILLLNQSLKDTYSKQVTVSLPETEIVTEKEKFLQKTLSYIYQNLDNPQLSVEILSTHMFISRASLYNRLLEYTGMSPVEFIRTVKLEKAKELLEKSDMTVTEIAYSTGFANPNYFAKVFKAKYNMTPSDFVAENKKKEDLSHSA